MNSRANESGRTIINIYYLDFFFFSDVELTNIDTGFVSGSLIEGTPSNEIVLSMTANSAPTSNGINGISLWSVGAWGSRNPDGSGKRINPVEGEVLSGAQSSINLTPGGMIDFGEVAIDYSMEDVTCRDINYICVELDKNSGANVEFNLIAERETMRRCEAVSCSGVLARTLSWDFRANEVRPNQRSPITVQASVRFDENSSPLTGSRLWRMSLFGSDNLDGNGRTFDPIHQILDAQNQRKSLNPQFPLTFNNVPTEYNVGAIGCGEYQFLCMEFTRADNSDPAFVFDVVGGGNKLVNCKQLLCNSDVVLQGMTTNIVGSPIVTEGIRNTVDIDTSVFSSPESRPLDSSPGLWQLSAYLTPSPDSPLQFNVQNQVLSRQQASSALNPGSPIDFGPVSVNVDLRQTTCEQAGYVCTRLSKGPSPRVDFNLQIVPDPSAVKSCERIECNGVHLQNNIDWTYNADDSIPGRETPISITTNLLPFPNSRDITGNDLWEMGLYGSKNPDGSGEKFNYEDQILSPEQAGTPLDGDTPFFLDNIDTNFDVGSVGCTDFRYLCVDFKKGRNPSTDFTFQIGDTAENTITSCKRMACDSSKLTIFKEEIQIMSNREQTSGAILALLFIVTKYIKCFHNFCHSIVVVALYRTN